MIDSRQIAAWRAAAPGFLRRQRKTLGQLRYGWDHPKTVSFVFGCQRSGTKMLMRVLDRSPATRIFHENNALAFDDFQLRDDAVLRALVAANPAPAPIFKPICDSQEADRILARWPEARGLWTWRHPDDVAASAVVKWGSHQREVVEAVARGDLARWGWRTARLSEGAVAAVRGAWRPDLTDHEGALLFWYLRNRLYFDLGLDTHPRMLLVTYEDLVTDAEHAFPRAFAHVGAPYDAAFLDRVNPEGARRKHVDARPEVRALVEELRERLEARARRPVHPPVPPRVLMLINTMGVGGAETYVLTVSNWLVEQGAEVTIASEPGGELLARLDPRVRHVPLSLGRVRADLPRMARRVRALAREARPTVVVTHSLAVTWVARVAGLGGRVPLVNVAHGWPKARYRSVGPLMRVADRVVAVSGEVRDELVGGGCDAGRVTVVENGVDCRPHGRRDGEVRRAARAALGAGPEDLLVLSVGRLEAQKAHQHVISAARRLAAAHPRLRWAVVGEGDRAAELASLAMEAGVADRVRFPGLRGDVPDLLGSADLYVNCSDWEGMPLSTIEAMAAGLPVIATRTEGATRLLDEANGVVVPVGDADALAKAVAELAADPARRAAMGAAGAARARERFSHERMAWELVRVLGGG